jgi:hypothetical protein
MFFADKLTFGQIQKSSDGYMKVRCRSGRAGIYQYLGREVDPEGKHFAADQVVNVYRSPEEVFDQQHLASFVGKPITIDHPAEPVTAGNWRTHAAGMIMGAVRDGEHIGFDLAFMDSASIQTVEAGKRELSNGYASKIVIGDGVAPDGQKYQARQVAMRGNHCAVVDQGRAGGTCRIGDAAICEPLPSDEVKALLGDGQTYSDSPTGDKNPSTNVERLSGDIQMPHTLVIDGLQVPNVSDEAKAAIVKLQGQLADAATAKDTADKALKDEQAKVVERDATITAKDATIKELEGKLADAAITPAKLADAAKAYADVCDKAKALGVTFPKDADADAVKKAVVAAKMGDAAKDYGAEHIAIAFDALTKDAKPADPLRATLKDGIKPAAPVGREGVDKARAAWLADKENGHRGPSIEVEA